MRLLNSDVKLLNVKLHAVKICNVQRRS